MRIVFRPLLGTCFLCAALAFLLPASPSAAQVPQQNSVSTASAALPVYIEEFFLSEAVRSEEHGELQLTLDSMNFRGKGNPNDGKSAGLDIEYGLTSRLQLSLELPYGIHSTATSELPVSWSTLSPGLLYQFIRGNRPFALSGALNVNLPVNGRGDLSFEPELLVAKGFGKLQIHTSLIPELGGDDPSLAYNAAAVRPLTKYLIPTFEFSGRHRSGINSFYLTPGLYTHLPHRLEVGAGIPVGLGSQSNSLGVVVKMTWEIGGDDDD